jgi:hypothetical protein
VQYIGDLQFTTVDPNGLPGVELTKNFHHSSSLPAAAAKYPWL